MKKSEDFSEWYNEIVELAGLTDKRYPIKGMNVWLPYGWKIMQHIDRYIRKYFDETDHQEVCFPLLIPESEFEKEKEHIKGFDEEVFWVTHAGLNPLDVKLLLRPTSETAMYPMFNLWVRSHADLPLKIYQIVNVFRYETKMTRAFIRVREIHFFESHTCHVDFEDAERQIRENIGIAEKLMRNLCLPYLLLKRTEWDKFPGAYYTIGIDTILPNGRSLQLGSIHQYRENFSRPYNIKYEDEKGEHRYVHQTTFGMSERLVGAIIAVHGDDKGIVLPPDVAPYQIVVVPIPAKGLVEQVHTAAKELGEELSRAGFRVHMDLRDVRPGSKFYDWEIKGVPIRLELGPRDIQNNAVTAVRRDTGEKFVIDRDSLVSKISELLEKISENLFSKAKKMLAESIHDASSLSDLPEKMIRVGWCGSKECGMKIETTTDRSILGNDVLENDHKKTRCVVCGKETELTVYLARPM
jgi:prolyl-tRNA synthetase